MSHLYERFRIPEPAEGEESEAPLEEIMQPFLDAVDEAETFEDLERRLLEAYPTVSTDKFRDLVERAVAMGAEVGYFEPGKERSN